MKWYATNLIIHEHHLAKVSKVTTLDELTSTEIYSILISKAQNKLNSNIYFENMYNDYNIDSTAIYTYHALLLITRIFDLFNTKS